MFIDVFRRSQHISQFIHHSPLQVWCCIIDKAEAVKRIKDRDGKTEDEAKARLSAQPPNADTVAEANVVFCTKWKGEFPQKQVEKAWINLQDVVKIY